MPKLRGLLSSRPKIDEEELALAQSRAAARLADLAERRSATPAEISSAADAVEDPASDDRMPLTPRPQMPR